MSMSRPLLSRIFIAAALAFAWFDVSGVAYVRGIPYPHDLSSLIDLSWATGPLAFAVLTAFYAAALARFIAARDVRAATAAFALLALTAHIHEAQWPGSAGVRNGLGLPGGGLAAYLLADRACVLFGRADQRERWSREAACGVAAAAYTLAAASKLIYGGPAWAGGANIAMYIASQAYMRSAALLPLRLWFPRHLALCGAFGVGTLIIEGSGLVFLWPRARPAYAVLACGLHLGIWLIMGLVHFDFLLMVVGLAL